MSLLFTIQALDSTRYEPILALARPTDDVERFYSANGVKALRWPGIGTWNYSHFVQGPTAHAASWWDLARVTTGWRRSEDRTLQLVKRVNPDLVHLNAVVLAPSARALARAGVPFVWHVREQPATTLTGWRTAVFRQMLCSYPSEVVFINNADREAWVHGKRGEVVYNFVDFARFDRALDGRAVRDELGISPDAHVILYAGGVNRSKGIDPLLGALERLVTMYPGLRCIAPGCVTTPPSGALLRVARTALPLVGTGTFAQRIERRMRAPHLRGTLLALPFRTDMERLIAASDVVVFPATVAHFARPAVEAAAMGKPVVASNLPGLDELVIDGETGVLVKARDPAALANGIDAVLRDPDGARRMGENGWLRARTMFSAASNGAQIMAIYDRILGKPGAEC